MSTAQQFPSKPQPSGPPLSPAVSLGTLEYTRAGTHQPVPIEIEIQGNIDKGFFQCEGEWTCYRRNYFSCICSYSLDPYYPKEDMQWSSNGSQPCAVAGFAMSISAVVAENENHNIELVQHTPKRDKGPTSKPDKIRLLPKPPNHHPHMGFYASEAAMGGPSRLGYGPEAYAPGHSAAECQTEYNFERIQFKQATANNGKRRAQQQYYHLLIELWADVGGASPDNFVRVAYSKSEKMIVRGRSPGHYQSERRRSASSGPGGSANRSMSGFPNPMMGQDFNAGNPMMGGGPSAGGAFGGGFDTRGMHPFPPARGHHQELPMDTMMPSDDVKGIDSDTRGYLYYPGTIHDDHQQQHHHHDQHQQQHRGPGDSRGSVDMFVNHRGSHDGAMSHMATSFDSSQERVKRESETTMLPRIFGQSPRSQRCSPFSGKSSSEGFYPTMNSQSGINIGNIT